MTFISRNPPLTGRCSPNSALASDSITVGLPGIFLCLFMGTIHEPSRKGVAIAKDSVKDEASSFPL